MATKRTTHGIPHAVSLGTHLNTPSNLDDKEAERRHLSPTTYRPGIRSQRRPLSSARRSLSSLLSSPLTTRCRHRRCRSLFLSPPNQMPTSLNILFQEVTI